MVTVIGKVIDSQSPPDKPIPIENATVVLGKEFALTGQNGDYIMTDLKPGTYTIIAIQRFYNKYEDTVTIMGDSEVNIKLQRE